MALKMYILIRDDVDLGHAILAAAHGSLGGYLTFVEPQLSNDPSIKEKFESNLTKLNTMEWVKNSFRKVVCRVTPTEFEKAKTYNLTYRVITESGLGGMETALVFAPTLDWPPFFKSLKLYK